MIGFLVIYISTQQPAFEGLGNAHHMTPLQLETLLTEGNTSRFWLVEFRASCSLASVRTSRVLPDLSNMYSNKNMSFGIVDIGHFPNAAEKFGISLGVRRLQFEVDANYRYMKVYDRLAVDRWQKQWIPCESMEELSLVNCLISPGRGLLCVLGKCKALEKLHLDMCVGVRDSDLVRLAQNSSKLKSISLRVPSDFSLPMLMNNPLRLTDESLRAIGENCSMLESVKISFCDGEFPSFSSFTLNGILCLIQACPIRFLSLDHVYSFNDLGMEALCSAHFLENLELVKCQEISDEGLQLARHFPCLTILRLTKCLGVTDSGLKPLVGTQKLELLCVEDCPQISEKGIQGAAKSIVYKQDLSWMY